MSPPTRRAFLGLAQGAVAVAALGALGVHFVGIAEAMSVPPGLGKLEQQSDLITRAQGDRRRRVGVDRGVDRADDDGCAGGIAAAAVADGDGSEKPLVNANGEFASPGPRDPRVTQVRWVFGRASPEPRLAMCWAEVAVVDLHACRG
jgi:hypothetical protein